jgi:hypothetical protein
MTTAFDWEGFRALAGRLDKLIAEGATDIDGNDIFAAEARKALSYLYTAGVSMPSAGDIFEDSGGDSFWERSLGDAEEHDPDAEEAEVSAIAERLHASVHVLQGEEDAEDLDELLWIAALNLNEVSNALAAGSAHFDAKRINEAAWEWSFGYDDWGARALASMTALHELLWGAL